MDREGRPRDRAARAVGKWHGRPAFQRLHDGKAAGQPVASLAVAPAVSQVSWDAPGIPPNG